VERERSGEGERGGEREREEGKEKEGGEDGGKTKKGRGGEIGDRLSECWIFLCSFVPKKVKAQEANYFVAVHKVYLISSRFTFTRRDWYKMRTERDSKEP
jgi:hypothetical protein